MGRGSLHFHRYTSITGSFRCVFFKTALTAWPSQMTAVLIRAHVGELFENLGKMRGVGISDHFPDISDLKAGICQQMLGLFNTQHIENIIEAFPGITVEQLRQVPLRDITGTRDLRQSQLFRIMLLHMLPNTFRTLLPAITIGFNNAVLAEASMSFLGSGVTPPDVSMGYMLSEAQGMFKSAPWYALSVGSVIALLVFGIGLIGEGMQRMNKEVD